jgi:hypothetical protein
LGQQSLRNGREERASAIESTEAATEKLAALPERYFELYSLAVEMADRTSGRRLTANSFFVTLNTGLAVLLGARSWGWYVAVAGVVLCASWWGLLTSYRDLNKAKFVVIHNMEVQLPVRIFSDEWATLKRGRAFFPRHWRDVRPWLGYYWEQGAVERVVPVVFAAMYLVRLVSQL